MGPRKVTLVKRSAWATMEEARTMEEILIAGAGPAGAAAALSARWEGATVRLVDPAKTARHKVCGEFLSPGVHEILEALGVWDQFTSLGPRAIRRCALHLGNHTKRWPLPECAWGLSRLQLDQLLLDKARAAGASVCRGERYESNSVPASAPVISAFGRRKGQPPGDRLFGFKAHFHGPADDAVELFFDRHGYVGVSGIENGLTNVCGIAPESLLRKYGFVFDDFVRRSPPLAERLNPLRREMRWLVAGPLSFSAPATQSPRMYPAGDALGFVDPFTGSGILNALLTGQLAGQAAARRIPPEEYLRKCRSLLRRPFWIASVLRGLAGQSVLHNLADWLPGPLLFRWTRADPRAVLSS